jgi:lipopolysaccharide/colanic/teichoic acid biosynthesis glycosyltransferase
MPNLYLQILPLQPYLIVRSIFERLVAAIALIVLLPIILGAILLVKSDGGPAFFYQERLGRNARIFWVIKLRTMLVNAESMLDERGRPTGMRVTRFGHFLRKTSIDELPQLINILKGDMSLIGPRPILPRMLPYMTDKECERFLVKPGVTGLAQVKGRNFIQWSRRFRYDIIYVRRQSFLLDLRILWRTLKLVIKGSGVAAEINAGSVDDVTIRTALREMK